MCSLLLYVAFTVLACSVEMLCDIGCWSFSFRRTILYRNLKLPKSTSIINTQAGWILSTELSRQVQSLGAGKWSQSGWAFRHLLDFNHHLFCRFHCSWGLCWNPAPWPGSCLSSWLASCGKWKARAAEELVALRLSVLPCHGDCSSARQVNEWLLKHIQFNSNWRQNTPSWKAEPCRSCFMSCAVVCAVVGGHCHQGMGTCSRDLPWPSDRIPQCRAELSVPSLAACRAAWLCAAACPQHCPTPEQQFQLESPGRRGYTFHAYCEHHQNSTNNFPHLHVTRVLLSNVQHSVHKPCLYLLTQSCLLQYFQINGGLLGDSSWYRVICNNLVMPNS